MIFHKAFIQRKCDILSTPQLFESRARVYKEVASWNTLNIDEVYFDFGAPDCGWLDVTIYVNGKKKHVFSLSAAFDPFHDLKIWMEDIVNDRKLSSELALELEGRRVIFHYEHLCLAQVGVGRKFVSENYAEDEWEEYDANNGDPDYGLFYLYDSGYEDIPVVCCCRTKDFIFALYNGLMYYAAKGKYASLIGKEWYYMDHDDEGNPYSDRWTFYNRLKSALIEWNYDSLQAYRHENPAFRDVAEICETVHMWAEWGGGLFWHQRGGCCGNANGFWVDAEGETHIDLTDMPELKVWYDEFNNGYFPEDPWPQDQFKDWLERGWMFAREIRKRLPACVDLFYHWKPFEITSEDANKAIAEIPILVPDERLFITREERYPERYKNTNDE